jgi:hypothetical protein
MATEWLSVCKCHAIHDGISSDAVEDVANSGFVLPAHDLVAWSAGAR